MRIVALTTEFEKIDRDGMSSWPEIGLTVFRESGTSPVESDQRMSKMWPNLATFVATSHLNDLRRSDNIVR